MTKIHRLLQYLICFLAAIVITVSFPPNSSEAHRPHDVISQIEISPNYEQDNTVYIIVRNNLYKSNDGGSNWRRITQGLDAEFFTALSSLALSPNNPQRLLLASEQNGIYRSVDGGESWARANGGLDSRFTDLLEISPIDGNLSLVTVAKEKLGEATQLYRTEDGANNWQKVLEHPYPITAISFSPTNRAVVLLGDREGNLLLSQDSGKSWTELEPLNNSGSITKIVIPNNIQTAFYVGTESDGIVKVQDSGKRLTKLDTKSADNNIRDITLNPKNPGYDLWISTWDGGTFVSSDEGETWQEQTQGLTRESQADDMKKPHFMEVRLSPNFQQDNTLFLGGFNGLFKSIDGGENWEEINTLSPGIIVSMDISPNYAQDSTVAVVTYVGYPYISHDQGQNWQAGHGGLEIPRLAKSFKAPDQDPRRFFDVAFSPNFAVDKQIFATFLWDEFLKSTDEGKSWKVVALPNPKRVSLRGLTVLPSPNLASDQTLYLGTQYGAIYVSTNGGESFKYLNQIEQHSTNEPISLVISPNFAVDQTLYASGQKGIYQSINGGKTWQPTNAGKPLASTNRYAVRLAISPNYSEDATVLAGTEAGLFMTTNGGESWQELLSPAYGDKVYVKDVAISPNYQNDRTFLISTSGQGLFKTTDAGQTFNPIGDSSLAFSRISNIPSAGIPIHFSPNYANDNTLYGFGNAETKVYKSTDGGNTWDTLSIATVDQPNYGPLKKIELFGIIHRSKILRFLLALVAAIITFFGLGWARLEKLLPFHRLVIQLGGTAIAFVLALIILWK